MSELSTLTSLLPKSQAVKDMATLMGIVDHMRQIVIHTNPEASEEIIESKTSQMMNLYLDI